MESPLAVVPVPEELAREVQGYLEVEVNPDALYDAAVAAIILGHTGTRASRQNHMYAIPPERLPRYRSGPNGGRVKWLGRDLLAFREEGRVG